MILKKEILEAKGFEFAREHGYKNHVKVYYNEKFTLTYLSIPEEIKIESELYGVLYRGKITSLNDFEHIIMMLID